MTESIFANQAAANAERQAITQELTAKRRELEAAGKTPKQIQSNKQILALQEKLETAKSASGLLTTAESLAILNRGSTESATNKALRQAQNAQMAEVLGITPAQRKELYNESKEPSFPGGPAGKWVWTGSAWGWDRSEGMGGDTGEGDVGGDGGGGGIGGAGGTGSGIGASGAGAGAGAGGMSPGMRSARDSALLLAQQYGLGGEFFNQLESFLFEDMSEASLIVALRSTDAYKKRFAANATRVSKGLPALSEGEYIRMEQLYRQELRAAGLPSTFYDDLNDFKTYIENDISYNEFVGRVGLARRASQMANPEVKKQLKDLYGVAESDLVGYFLNPDKTRSMIERQFNVAQTAAALGRAGFGTTMAGELTTAITGGRPETIIDYGQLEAAAQTAGVARPLSQEVLGGEGGAVTEQDLLRGVIAEDVQSQRRIQREQQKRLAEYQAGGALMESQQGVLGLRSAAR